MASMPHRWILWVGCLALASAFASEPEPKPVVTSPYARWKNGPSTDTGFFPIAGWLLTGKEQSLVVAYYRVSGSVKDPHVTPIPLKSVGRAVFGIFRNLLEIPEALIGPLEEQPPQPIKSDEKERS